MTQEQHDYEMGCAGQAQAEYEAQMAYYEYLDSLIADKQYQLHAVEIALDMLNSKEFANSGMSPKDWLDAERKRLAVKSLNDGAKLVKIDKVKK
jgi:hypothetical protein